MSDSNPYAAFGVHNAVLTSDTIEDHRQNMLAEDVAVRDGDDSVDLVTHEDAGVTVTDLVDDPLATDDKVEVTINTEGQDLNVADEGDETETDPEGEPEGDATDDAPLGEPTEALTAAQAELSEYADGFNQMRDQAIANGLPADVAARIESEYEANNKLSDESYEALKAAGYSKGFVDSFMRGQEAIAERYVQTIVDYAGGSDKFNAIVQHLQSSNPDAVESLYEAMERQDIKSVKATLNLGIASRQAKFGKAPTRSVTKSAPASAPAKAAIAKVEGFNSTDDMVKAMGDRRYSTDPKYREAVRAKVAASNF